MSDFSDFLITIIVFNFVSSWVLSFIYFVFRVKKPSESKREQHRNLVLVVGMTLYAIAELHNAFSVAPPTFYALLDAHPTDSLSTIKSNFKRLSLQHHPDKSADQDSTIFYQLKTALDVLTSEQKRMAYERIGDDVLTCQHCTTFRDFLQQQLLPVIIGNLLSLAVILVINFLSGSRATFWIVSSSCCLLAFEINLLVEPKSVFNFWPLTNLLIFQQRRIIHLLSQKITFIVPSLINAITPPDPRPLKAYITDLANTLNEERFFMPIAPQGQPSAAPHHPSNPSSSSSSPSSSSSSSSSPSPSPTVNSKPVATQEGMTPAKKSGKSQSPKK